MLQSTIISTSDQFNALSISFWNEHWTMYLQFNDQFSLTDYDNIGRCYNMLPPCIKSNTSFWYTRSLCDIQFNKQYHHPTLYILRYTYLRTIPKSSYGFQHRVPTQEWPSFKSQNEASFSSLLSITNLYQFWCSIILLFGHFDIQ